MCPNNRGTDKEGKKRKTTKTGKKRTNKQNSSWSPKALMKREFSSLSENFSPLQRLACISKVTASVCSFVCVCVLLLSCCLGCESGWRVCRGHKETVCLYAYECVCVSEWTPAGLEQQPEPPKRTPGLSGRWRAGVASHLVLQEVPGGRVYLCMSMCVCLCAVRGGGGTHTRPVYPPISIRQTARKFQQSAIEWWWGRGERWITEEDRKAKTQRATHLASVWSCRVTEPTFYKYNLIKVVQNRTDSGLHFWVGVGQPWRGFGSISGAWGFKSPWQGPESLMRIKLKLGSQAKWCGSFPYTILYPQSNATCLLAKSYHKMAADELCQIKA